MRLAEFLCKTGVRRSGCETHPVPMYAMFALHNSATKYEKMGAVSMSSSTVCTIPYLRTDARMYSIE